MVGVTHGQNSGLVYYLGTGTSFDVSGIPGYHNLTIDNFIVGMNNVSSSSWSFGSSGNDTLSVGASGAGFSKSYNATTGKLSIGILRNNSISVSFRNNDNGSSGGIGSGGGSSVEVFAYLVKGKIKTI